MIPDLRNWRDVPMPAAVARLPLDKRGFPIPWVGEWSGTRDDDAHMSPQVERGVVSGHCDCMIGYGTPNLGAVCPTRQRAGMLDRRCGVCGGNLGARVVFMGHLENKTYSEPPVHLACGLYAAQVCPGLITPTKVGNTGVCVTRRYEIVAERGIIPPLGEEVTLKTGKVAEYGGCVMMVHASPVGGERLSLPAFLDRHLAGAR